MPPWAPYPGLPPGAQLILEAFGRLSRDTHVPGVVTEDEDLWSVFRARGELMHWSSFEPEGPRLWSLEEAELTAGSDPSRIGWVQVGINAERPLTILPALFQCFDDALRRFGSVELSALRLTCRHLQPGATSSAGQLVSGLNWFNIPPGTGPDAGPDALVAFDTGLVAGRSEAEIVVQHLWQMNTGRFVFGLPQAATPDHAIQVPAEAGPTPPEHGPPGQPSSVALPVTPPEWTASATAWVLALVIDTARAQNPDAGNFTVQIARVDDRSRT